MNLKSIVLAGAAVVSLAAPAGAFAQPYYGDWHDHDDWRRQEWRQDAWREHEWRDHAWGYGGYGYAPRCFVEERGFYNWYGRYVANPVRVCR